MGTQYNVIPASRHERILIEKIRALSPDKLIQVEDFVDFLRHKNMGNELVHASNSLAEEVFGKVWDNPEDEDYDRL